MTLLVRKPQRTGRLSSELEELIRGAIQRGELKPGQRLGSAKQLAKHWKTSYGAVRQSLETLAAKGLVERRPRAGTFVSSNADAVGARGETRGIIGLLVPDIRMPEYSLIARHLQDAGHKAHFEVLVSSTDNERERYDQSVLRHIRAGVGGLILVSPHQSRISLQTLLELEKSQIPVVNYARTVDVVRWPTVQTDIFKSAYLPVKHLCDLGRRRIAFLNYPCGEAQSTQMMYGLFRAVAEAGISASNVVQFSVPDTFYLKGWSDRSALGQVLNDWLDQNKDIDAVCCMHDHIAATMLAVLAQRGVRVPDDVAITGHGNFGELFGLAPRELTSIDTHIEKAAEEMVRLLQPVSSDSADHAEPQVYAIEPQLVIGRSTSTNF